jgi:glycosyltransferase involved in cell wall biosynthesis
MKRLHICYICNEYPPASHGGVGVFTRTMARAMASREHRVTVVGFYRVPRTTVTRDGRVRVIRVPHTRIPGAGLVSHAGTLRRVLRDVSRRTPIDVVEGPENGLALLPRSFPAARIVRLHGGHRFYMHHTGRNTRPIAAWLESRSVGNATALCAVSQFVAEESRRLLELRGSISILPNPVDTMLFAPVDDEPEDPNLVLFVGSVCEQKGIRPLVAAMHQVIREVPGARLLVVGRDRRGPGGGSFIEELRSSLDGARHNVEFRPPVEHAALPRLMAGAAICAFPSRMEAQGLVWLEAMAVGKPVVGGNVGPAAELVEDGRTGLLCDPGSPDAIAAALIRLLRDPAERRRMGGAARQRALEHFSLPALVDQNEQFYLSCVDEHANR